MSHSVDPRAVGLWLERLRSGTEKDQVRAASELSRLHIRTRGSVRTRGGLRQSAANAFPPELRQDARDIVLYALRSESPDVRREVAYALGEWGDEDAAGILRQLVTGDAQDPEEEVRRAAITALGTIGGPTAVQALCQVAEEDDSDVVRYDAVSALARLTSESTPSPAIRTRGAVRTRGAPVRARGGLGAEDRQVFATLHRIRDNDDEREHIRRLAEAALGSLAG